VKSVHVSLDSSLLGLAGGFPRPKDPQDAGAKQAHRRGSRQGIYVRNYTFEDRDISLPGGRGRGAAPGSWRLPGDGKSLVKVRKEKDHTNVDS